MTKRAVIAAATITIVKPNVVLTKPFLNKAGSPITVPTLAAMEGPRSGAMTMAPITTAVLFIRRPNVATKLDMMIMKI